jgi:hypothetical protein
VVAVDRIPELRASSSTTSVEIGAAITLSEAERSSRPGAIARPSCSRSSHPG